MAYIGRGIDNISQIEVLDLITFTDSAGPYNILKGAVAFIPSTVNSLLIEVDGIIQAPASYTIDGSTITFGASMASTSTMNSMIHFGTGLITTPADNSVTAAKIASNAVTTAKILDNNVTVAKLPTTLDISGNTVTLPASVSGLGTGITNAQLAGSITDAKITGLSSSKLSGLVPVANLGTGTASASTYLAGDQSYKALSEYDDDAVKNDIATLALHQATNANAAKYNLVNTNVDQYEDSTGIASFTDCVRDSSGEYITTISSSSNAIDWNLVSYSNNNSLANGGWTGTLTGKDDLMAQALHSNAEPDHLFDLAQDFVVKMWYRPSGVAGTAIATQYMAFSTIITTDTSKASGTNPSGVWRTPISDTDGAYWDSAATAAAKIDSTYASTISASSISFSNQTGSHSGSVDCSDASKIYSRYQNSGNQYFGWRITYDASASTMVMEMANQQAMSTFDTGETITLTSVPSTGRAMLFFGNNTGDGGKIFSTFSGGSLPDYSTYQSASANATGNFISTATVANASVSSMGAVITYKNNEGTNTLNTDIILEVSANGGTNWTTAVLTAGGTFSTGILQAVANDISVTAGTSIQYRISFANQSEGSKEARIYGASLIY